MNQYFLDCHNKVDGRYLVSVIGISLADACKQYNVNPADIISLISAKPLTPAQLLRREIKQSV